MPQRRHLVFGGELTDPAATTFSDVNDIHIVGIFPDREGVHDARKEWSHRTVDNAHMRDFIARLHRLRDEEREASMTEEMGGEA